MGLAALERRVAALEQAFLPRANTRQCNCRAGQETKYYNAMGLEQMMGTCCPVHELRDLGHVAWLPSGLPLRPEDQHHCSCPPCPVRGFMQGTRPPLSSEEQEAEERRWQAEYEDSGQRFRREQSRAEALLHRYQQKRGKL
jgi:hypothetical protein